MTRWVPWLSVVVACSQPSSPPVKSPPPVVAAPAPVPAVSAPAAPPAMIVGEAGGYTFRDPQRRTKLAAAFPAIDKALEEERKNQNLPGIAIGIVIDGELAYTKGLGVVSVDGKTVPDADTVYRIGSITKSFTGLALLALRDDGALELDDPLAKWLPGAAKLVYPTRDSQPITLRQLANHTSGLPRMGTFDFEATPTEAAVVASLAKLPLDTAPGTHFEYSNLGFGLLGLAVGHAGKSSYHDVVAARILTPLGMTATTWDHEQVPAGKLAPAYMPGPKGPVANPKPARLGDVDGAGGIYSSVRDMAKYVAFQLAAYPPRSDADAMNLRRATVREAHSTGVPSGLKHEPPAVATSYGFGWSRFESCKLEDLVAHNGGIDSYRSEVQFSPSRGVGVVVLTNFGEGNPSAFAERVLTELDKTGALAPRTSQPSPVLAESLQRLLAIYHQWDEPAFAKILARPIDPREKDELATYQRLHGKCTGFELAGATASTAGRFDVTCERGSLQIELNANAQGQIQGFIGFSRGVEAPAAWAGPARAVVGLHNKWSDAVFRKYLAKGPVPLETMKKMASTFHARHGDCKVTGAIHFGFDWGYSLACKKEDVEMFVMTPPDDPSKIIGIQLRPRTGAPKRCD